MISTVAPHAMPESLLNWAGHRSGGVRRLFDSSSGRPTGQTLRTRLLERLEGWASNVATDPNAPRAILLVGGPGNGKTEAVEFSISELDNELKLSGALKRLLTDQFLRTDDAPVPRFARVSVGALSEDRYPLDVCIVQDASMDNSEQGIPAAAALLSDLDEVLNGHNRNVYLACVNRGILDDALILATDEGLDMVRQFLETVVRSVGMGPNAPACWPLDGFPAVAVWPMDIESLVGDAELDEAAPSTALQLLNVAIDEDKWPKHGSCPAGDRCPFCNSRQQLSGEPHRSALLATLRRYELASGKRWTFRDLFSLYSYLLAGIPPNSFTNGYHPCRWAASINLISQQASAAPKHKYSSKYQLVAAQYQHALFGKWPTGGIRKLRADLVDLKLTEDAALMGLYFFLLNARSRSAPPTLESQLDTINDMLDPAIADPDMPVELSKQTTILYRDIDTRFSQSILEGLSFINKYRCITKLEVELLRDLGESEARLLDSEAARIRSAAVARIRAFARDFACRLVRRSIGTRVGAVRDSKVLAQFQKVVAGDVALMHDAAKQVESLLNDKEKFLVVLNTTFGEPMPPLARRAVLTTSKQKVRIQKVTDGERPNVAFRFLAVGSGGNEQTIPLTYELYRSVFELKRGMSPAALPREVVALLDTTRAKLAGQVVRSSESLEGGEIRIGTRKDVVFHELGKFLARLEGQNDD